jgi:peptidoglycan-associated lipoprotein
MRQVAIFVGALAALVSLTGCPPTYPKCNNDDNCKDHNEVCVQGTCRECAADQNCKAGFICEDNKCVPKPECTTNANCGPGKRCQAGKCVEGECATDADCGTGKCRNNKCLAPNACVTDDDCGEGQTCSAGTCVSKSADRCKFEAIHFEFDKYSLTPEAEHALQNVADCLKSSPQSVTLEGHADERGTDEYNMQLSNRRASSTKKYLSTLGVPSKSLDTIGYGFHRPAVDGHDESAWAANRRVEFRRK